MVTIDGCLNYCIQKSRTDNFNYMYAGLQVTNTWLSISAFAFEEVYKE